MICLLCKEKEANQTGSHIFTNSLVKSCLNVEGKTGRDDELIFSFSNSGQRDLFIGKTTSVDKVEEVLGRPITDEELANNSNKIVVDNIYCTDCEKLFGRIESPFTDRVLKKIRENKVFAFKFPDNILIRLYFYIQIWRASSCNYAGWYLINKDLEEHLRRLIFDSCKSYDKGLPKELEEAVIKFPLVVNYLETPKGEKSTNLFFIDENINPYYFFLCDFIVEFLPYNNINEKVILENKYGINDDIKEIEINCNEENFIVRSISDEKRREIKKPIISNYAKKEIEKIRIKLIETYLSRTGTEIPEDKFLLFANIFFNYEDVPLAARWSDERFEKIFSLIIEV